MKYYYKIKGNKTIFSPSLLGGKSSQIGTAIDSEERDTRTVPPSYINPEWPKLYSNVIVFTYDNRSFKGYVVDIGTSERYFLIYLPKDINTELYTEKTSLPKGWSNVCPNGHGCFYATGSTKWKYNTEYDNTEIGLKKNEAEVNKLRSQANVTNPGEKKDKTPLYDTPEEKKKISFNKNGAGSKKEENIINVLDNTVMQTDFDKKTNNSLYYPLIDQPTDWFSERKIDQYISDNSGIANPNMTSKLKEDLKNELNKFKPIKDPKTGEYALGVGYIVHPRLSINNLITIPNDEIHEGKKIMDWVKGMLGTENKFSDLNVIMHKGYVWITRNGVSVIDTLNNNLFDQPLKHFDSMLGKPIEYELLKHYTLPTEFELTIPLNNEQRNEANNIMSQEYLIALQPQPKYQLWCLQRLITAWYANEELNQNIRKIKVLINQYRADPTKEHNKANGIYPSILIYPKYGIDSMKSVLKSVSYLFSLYYDASYDKNVADLQWQNSKPKFFKKFDELIYWTNGSTDLKRYTKKNMESSVSKNKVPFTQDYTEFKESKKVIYS
jgi:hypothetical protein